MVRPKYTAKLLVKHRLEIAAYTLALIAPVFKQVLQLGRALLDVGCLRLLDQPLEPEQPGESVAIGISATDLELRLKFANNCTLEENV